MTVKSKLSDAQWLEISKARLEGVPVRTLAKQYGVSIGLISERFSGRTPAVKLAAEKLVAADRAMNALMNNVERSVARSLADDLELISGHVLTAARHSATTASRLAYLANSHSNSIDDGAPDSGQMNMVNALQKMANSASEIPMGLLKANAEFVEKQRALDAGGDDGKLTVVIQRLGE